MLHLFITDLILMTSKVYLIEGKAQKKQLGIRQFGMLANRFIIFFKFLFLLG